MNSTDWETYMDCLAEDTQAFHNHWMANGIDPFGEEFACEIGLVSQNRARVISYDWQVYDYYPGPFSKSFDQKAIERLTRKISQQQEGLNVITLPVVSSNTKRIYVLVEIK